MPNQITINGSSTGTPFLAKPDERRPHLYKSSLLSCRPCLPSRINILSCIIFDMCQNNARACNSVSTTSPLVPTYYSGFCQCCGVDITRFRYIQLHMPYSCASHASYMTATSSGAGTPEDKLSRRLVSSILSLSLSLSLFGHKSTLIRTTDDIIPFDPPHQLPLFKQHQPSTSVIFPKSLIRPFRRACARVCIQQSQYPPLDFLFFILPSFHSAPLTFIHSNAFLTCRHFYFSLPLFAAYIPPPTIVFRYYYYTYLSTYTYVHRAPFLLAAFCSFDFFVSVPPDGCSLYSISALSLFLTFFY